MRVQPVGDASPAAPPGPTAASPSMPLGTKALFDALLKAVEEQDIETLKLRREEFISHHENFVHCVDMDGNTILHKASQHVDIETMVFCVEQLGCEVEDHLNARNALGKTALHEAAKMNLVSCIEYLLGKGADLSASSEVGSTPFHTACASGSVDAMESMLKFAEREGGEERKLEIVNAHDSAMNCPIHKCAFDGNVRVLRVLLDNGAAIEARDRHDCTAAHIAVKVNQVDFVMELIERGKTWQSKDALGKEKEKTWDINVGDAQFNTLLHYAVARCYHAMVRQLVDLGADINKGNEDGNTPLHIAAQCFQPDSQEWEDLVLDMLRMGANHEAVNERVTRKPDSYVPRNVQYLFDPKEWRRRDDLAARKLDSAATAQAEMEEKKRAFKEQIRETHKQREKMRQEVMEERRREEEERQRREEEELKRLEEEEEKRKEEEEAAKKKKGKKGG